MYDLDGAYSPKFFRQRKSLNWRARIIADAIIKTFEHKLVGSVVDVGCGNGDILKTLIIRGPFVGVGIEGTENAKHGSMLDSTELTVWDFRKPISKEWMRLDGISIRNKFDLALCLEVAEHIEDEYVTTFIKNLTSLSDTIIFSAAPPGQGGRYHVNCRSFEYWFYKFDLYGFRHIAQYTTYLKWKLWPWKDKKGIKAFYQNITVWERYK